MIVRAMVELEAVAAVAEEEAVEEMARMAMEKVMEEGEGPGRGS